jgi:flagellin
MKELAVQASSGTYSSTDRAALNLEFSQLQSEMQRIAGNTQRNGLNILDGAAGGSSATVNYQVGAGSGQTMAATFNTLYKNVATSTGATRTRAGGAVDKYDIDISGANAQAGDLLKITLQDSSNNSVDILLKLDSTAVASLQRPNGNETKHYLDQAADIYYLDNGYSALNSVLGQAGDNGIVVSVGSPNGTASVANKVYVAGTNADQGITIASAGVTIIRGEVASLDAFDVSTAVNAQKAVSELDTLITNVAAGRAKYGAYINRLEHASDNLTNVAQNTDSSRSQIEDADYASETSELARTQIIAQASTAMLAQANQSKQSVLTLLQ